MNRITLATEASGAPLRGIYAVTGGISYPASGGALGTTGRERRWNKTIHVVASSMERALAAASKAHPDSVFERAELLGEVAAVDTEIL